MGKVSSYSENTNPATTDFVLGETTSGPTTNRFKLLSLIALAFNNLPAAATGIGSAVQSYTPTLSNQSGGTWSAPTGKYLNLAGLKIAWGTVSISSTTSTGHCTVSLPASFFASVSAAFCSIMAEGNSAYQTASGDSVTGSPPSAFQFYVGNTANGSSAVVSWLIVGA